MLAERHGLQFACLTSSKLANVDFKYLIFFAPLTKLLFVLVPTGFCITRRKTTKVTLLVEDVDTTFLQRDYNA